MTPARIKPFNMGFLTTAMAVMLVACSPATVEDAGNNAATAAQQQCEPKPLSPDPDSGLERASICVDADKGVHELTVELAQTREQQAKGLMFRTSLPPGTGMLFPFDPPKQASFWMKNTVIPLDIIFVDDDGIITNIAVNAEPYSLEPLRSDGEVAAVLELGGGQAAALGLSAGDRIGWPR